MQPLGAYPSAEAEANDYRQLASQAAMAACLTQQPTRFPGRFTDGSGRMFASVQTDKLNVLLIIIDLNLEMPEPRE